MIPGEEASVTRPDESARAVYGISVAAELTGAGVQNLRVYERHGLVAPSRTEGGTRRYSEHDLDRVRRVLDLLEAGLNLAGIARVMQLEDDNARLRRRLRDR
jgi:MerR family transcriptional regulator, heat shock protein HspR